MAAWQGLQNARQRRYLSIIDGIVAGEGEGPLATTPKSCGLIIRGVNPVFVDLVTTRLMDFDYHKIPLWQNAFNMTRFPLPSNKIQDIVVRTNINSWESLLKMNNKCYEFVPPQGWRDHIEL